MGKLKIRCAYSLNGCKEILSLNNLENHQKICRFENCENCFCIKSIDHNCVKSLHECMKKSNEIICDLRNELKLANDKISSMKSEMGNYLQTIKDLSNTKSAKTTSTKYNNLFLKNIKSNAAHENVSNTPAAQNSSTNRGNRWYEAISVNTLEKPPECKQQ